MLNFMNVCVIFEAGVDFNLPIAIIETRRKSLVQLEMPYKVRFSVFDG